MSAEIQMVGFRVGEQSYAVPIESVREIVRTPEIASVPQSPRQLAGVMNLRGRIVPVMDLRRRFGGSGDRTGTSQACSRERVLVLTVGGKLLGAMVDAASEVLKIAPDAIEPSPKLFGDNNESYVTGVAKYAGKLVVLVDPNKLLPDSEITQGMPAIAAEPGLDSPGCAQV